MLFLITQRFSGSLFRQLLKPKRADTDTQVPGVYFWLTLGLRLQKNLYKMRRRWTGAKSEK